MSFTIKEATCWETCEQIRMALKHVLSGEARRIDPMPNIKVYKVGETQVRIDLDLNDPEKTTAEPDLDNETEAGV